MMMQGHLHRGVTLNKSVLTGILGKRLFLSQLAMDGETTNEPTWLLVQTLFTAMKKEA